jgi:hypothetical protein
LFEVEAVHLGGRAHHHQVARGAHVSKVAPLPGRAGFEVSPKFGVEDDGAVSAQKRELAVVVRQNLEVHDLSV